jgi:hypothetical protein
MFEKKQGFEISIDDARNILKIRAWGFWDEEIAGKYKYEFKNMINEMKTRGKEWYTLVDVTDYSPQSARVKKIVKERMVLATESGLKKEARIVRSLPTKWQMAQLAKQSELPISAEFQTEDEAIQWLSNDQLR